MSSDFTDLHKMTKRNLSSTGSGQKRTFFYARIGAESLLYIGRAGEKKLDLEKMKKVVLKKKGLDRISIRKRPTSEQKELNLQQFTLKKSLTRSRWMTGTLVKDGKHHTFTRKKGPVKADDSVKKRITKVFKAIGLASATLSLQSAPEEEEPSEPRRKRQEVKVKVDSSDHVTSTIVDSLPDISAGVQSGLEAPPVPGTRPTAPGRPGSGGGHHKSTGEIVGKVLGTLAPELISSGASMLNSTEELTSDDSTVVEKVSSTVSTGGTLTETVAHGIALGTHLHHLSEAHSTLSSPDRPTSPPDHSSSPTDHSSTPRDHIERLVSTHKRTEKLVQTLDKVSHVAGEVAGVAGVVYSGAKAVRAGKDLYEATTHKEALRGHIRHMKVIDSLQKRFAGQEEELDIRKNPVVGSLMKKFKKEMKESTEKAPVGKRDVIDSLRLFVEIQTSSQKQSGVDLVANALKVAGGISTLSGVGAGVGTGLALTGAGLQLTKAGVDKAVGHGRESKHGEELALRETLETSELSEEAQAHVAALIETEQQLLVEKKRLTSIRSELRARKHELEKLQEKLAREEALNEIVDDVLDDLDSSDDDDLDFDVEDFLDDITDDVEAIRIQEELAALKASLKESQASMTSLRAQHAAVETTISDTVLPEIFKANQQQRLEEILTGKVRREKVTDGKELGFMERVSHETSVNEDASESAMAARRDKAVEVLMNGKIPPFLRLEMIAMLGIDEAGWQQLQEADEDTRREALRILMVV